MASFLTRTDVDNYGSDLVDFAQRAAAHALAPSLQQLEQQNAELQQRLAREARHRLDASVEAAVPDYRDIDRDPEWHNFLLQTDPLSGRIRQVLLNDAIAQGDAGRVISFFHGFQRQSGHSSSSSSPGRTTSRGARTASPYDRPTYTRDQIRQIYRAHQQGAYAGRELEWVRQEAEIIRAGREGRILGSMDIQGK